MKIEIKPWCKRLNTKKKVVFISAHNVQNRRIFSILDSLIRLMRSKTVKQWQVTCWPQEDTLPSSGQPLLTVFGEVDSNSVVMNQSQYCASQLSKIEDSFTQYLKFVKLRITMHVFKMNVSINTYLYFQLHNSL